jgi:hypothetical protein
VIADALILQYLGVIKDWAKPIQQARGSHNLQAIDLKQYFTVPIPDTPTQEQRHFIRAVELLGAGAERLRTIQTQSLFLNFEMMAFAILWFGMVSHCPLPLHVVLTIAVF